jgi:CheY-like chemotaxis protein
MARSLSRARTAMPGAGAGFTAPHGSPAVLSSALLLHPHPLPRRTIRQALRSAGMERVLEADSAAEALRLLSAELVQLVLTPWEVPDLAGRPLVQALRNRGRNRNLPVVLLDAGLAPPQVVAAVKAGIAGRLALPADAAAVRALLAQLVAEGVLPAPADAKPRPTGARPKTES